VRCELPCLCLVPITAVYTDLCAASNQRDHPRKLSATLHQAVRSEVQHPVHLDCNHYTGSLQVSQNQSSVTVTVTAVITIQSLGIHHSSTWHSHDVDIDARAASNHRSRDRAESVTVGRLRTRHATAQTTIIHHRPRLSPLPSRVLVPSPPSQFPNIQQGSQQPQLGATTQLTSTSFSLDICPAFLPLSYPILSYPISSYP